MSVEFWNSVFQWGSVGLLALTFFCGAGALWTGNRINARQTARILVLETDLTNAKTLLSAQEERTAKAELQLAEIKERENDRTFTDEQFLKLVAALSSANQHPLVQMMFIGQGEPRRFAELLLSVFESAGWKAEIVRWNRAGILTPGVFVESRQGDAVANQAARYVAQQLVNVGTPAMTGEAVEPPLPPDTLLIRIGPRPR